MRIVIKSLIVFSLYATLCIGTMIVAKRVIRPPAEFEPATAAQYSRFQEIYNEFSHADVIGDWTNVYAHYMTSDFEASSAVGHGPTWNLYTERVEARERKNWQFGVAEKRQIESAVIRDGVARVTYLGHLTCTVVVSGGSSEPYDEQWTTEDTWTFIGGKWKLSTSVALSSTATIGGQPANHSSIMPVWADT